jgi:O-antigen/teichoic acid export membrane protein
VNATFRRRLFHDGLYTFGARLCTMVLAASLGVLTARVLGSHGRGLYATPMVSAGIVSAGFAGLSSATSYFLLRRNAGRGVIRTALLAGMLFVVVAAIVSATLAVVGHAAWAAPAAMLSLPGPACLMIATGYATGTRRIRLTTLFGAVATGLALASMAAFFFAAGLRSPSGAIVSWVVSSNLGGAALITWLLIDSRDMLPGKAPFFEYLRFAGRSGAVGLVSLLNYRADIYIVAVLGTPAMLGMYTLAVSAAEALLAATAITAVVTAPYIGSLDDVAAANLAARAVRHNVIVAGVCCTILAVAAPLAVKVLYGATFLPVVPALRILLVGVFALSLGSPMSTYFTIRLGRPEVPLILASVSAAVCVAGSLIMVPRIGLVGAALASTIAYIGGQAAAIGYFGWVSGIDARTMLLPRASDVMAYVQVITQKRVPQ